MISKSVLPSLAPAMRAGNTRDDRWQAWFRQSHIFSRAGMHSSYMRSSLNTRALHTSARSSCLDQCAFAIQRQPRNSRTATLTLCFCDITSQRLPAHRPYGGTWSFQYCCALPLQLKMVVVRPKTIIVLTFWSLAISGVATDLLRRQRKINVEKK